MADSSSDLRLKLRRFLYRQKDLLGDFCRVAEEQNIDVCLFGGASRGGINTEYYTPRDFDLVVADQSYDDLLSFFNFQDLHKNRFGGVKVEYKKRTLDIWPLGKTWAFTEQLVANEGFESLPKTTFFNADAFAVDLKGSNNGRSFYEYGFFDCLENKILDVNLEENPYPELCVVRALKLSKQYDFCWSQTLLDYINNVISETPISHFLQIEKEHYGDVLTSALFYKSLQNSIEHYLSSERCGYFTVFQDELFVDGVSLLQEAKKSENVEIQRELSIRGHVNSHKQ